MIPESSFSKFDLEQGKSEGFDSCDRASNLTQIGFKSLIFQPVTLNLMDDLEKTLGHFFYTKSSFVHRFKAIDEFKLELQSGNTQFGSKLAIGKTPVRIILWCPITKMLIKACFLVQPLEQEGVYQKCCISLCSKVFINHFCQMKASPECLNILTYCSKYWVDRLRRTIGRKV